MSDIPRLSKTIAKALLDQSPAHAYMIHPLLGGEQTEPTPAMLEGSIFEALLTGYDEDRIVVVDAANFQTKAAREAKAEAIANRCWPITAPKFDDFVEAATILRKKMKYIIPDFFDAEYGVRAEWEASGVACSGVLDGINFFSSGGWRIYDIKKCASAHPEAVAKAVTRDAWDIQRAAYTEAVETRNPAYAGRGDFVFIAYEIDPPYMVQCYHLEATFQELGERRWDHAKSVWKKCLASDTWPGYSPKPIVTVEATPWQTAQLERYSSV